MKNFSIKSFLPHTLIILAFFALLMVFFGPVLQGKKLRQSDIEHSRGGAKEIQDIKEKTGHNPMWTNSMFGGMPSYQIAGSQETNIFKYLTEIVRFNLPAATISVVFLYLLCFYFLLLTLRLDPWLSFTGAVAFAFATYNFLSIEAGHVTKAYAIAFIPLVITGVIQIFRGNSLGGVVLTAIAIGLELYCNHIQITYYLVLMVIIMMIVYFIYAWREKKVLDFVKKSSLLGLASILALAPNIVTFWTNSEYVKETMRGKAELSELTAKKDQSSGLAIDYAFGWSYGIAETATILIPNFMGSSNNEALDKDSESYKELKERGVPNANKIVENMPMYWGTQPFTSGPIYFGAVIMFLFVLALFLVKGPEKWWLLGAIILSVLLSWGRNFMAFNEFIFYNFPLYNKFRTVLMILSIASFAIVMLGFIGLKQIVEKTISKQDIIKAVKKSLYILGGFTLFFALFPGAFFNFTADSDVQLAKSGFPDWLIAAMEIDRKSMMASDSWRSLIFILLTAGLIWAYATEKIKKNGFYAALAFLVIIDLVPVGKRYITKDDFTTKKQLDADFQPTSADLQILEDKDPDYRVFNLTVNPFADSRTSYFHKSIGGYHAAKLRRYQDLIDRYIGKNDMNVLNMLNTKYFIVPDQNKNPVVQRNPGALGNAWFVEDYKVVANADSELNGLGQNFNPAKIAIVDKKFKDRLSGFDKNASDSAAAINLVSYMPNHLVYQSKSSAAGLAVFSEIYYEKGWNAYIDGALTPHLRADYVLRSLVVPAGEHKIEFKFEPVSYYTGRQIALAGSGTIVVLLIIYIINTLRKRKPSEV